MENMSDSRLPHGKLPPIPDGCGVLPVAENRIARGPVPELLDAVPEGFDPPAALAAGSEVNDALEPMYRLVLTRALAIAGGALLFAALLGWTLTDGEGVLRGGMVSPLMARVIFALQVLAVVGCSRYVTALSMGPAAALLFGYAGFTACEFSLLGAPLYFAVAFLCCGLMYLATAAYGYWRGADLARPIVMLLMQFAGIAILLMVNCLLGTPKLLWAFCGVAQLVFTLLAGYHAQEIRDLYQNFDDDNAQGWKASVLGALLLFMNSVNVYLLLAAVLPEDDDDDHRQASD